MSKPPLPPSDTPTKIADCSENSLARRHHLGGPLCHREAMNGKRRAMFSLTKTRCLLIFGEPDYYASKRHRKLERCEVFQVWQTVPTFLNWSDHADHPKHVPRPRAIPTHCESHHRIGVIVVSVDGWGMRAQHPLLCHV
jgi:hypothetical protein